MSDDAPKPIRLKADGTPDGRGHGEGSKATRFAHDDGRPRRGRTKGALSERTEIDLIRNMTVGWAIGRRRRRVTTRLAYLVKLREKAIRGDLKAIEMLDKKLAQHEPPSVDPDLTQDLLEADKQILAHARRLGLIPPEVPPPVDGDEPPPPLDDDTAAGANNGQ